MCIFIGTRCEQVVDPVCYWLKVLPSKMFVGCCSRWVGDSLNVSVGYAGQGRDNYCTINKFFSLSLLHYTTLLEVSTLLSSLIP